MKFPIILAGLIALGAAFAPLESQAQPHVSVTISTAPPAPIYERIPVVRSGYDWAPGYWEWRGRRHAWVPGHYIAARPGYVYAPPSWHHRGGRWVMEPSRWDRGPRHGHRPVHVVGGPRDHHYRDRDHHGRGHDRDHHPGRGHGKGHDRDHDRGDHRGGRDRDHHR